MKHAGELHPFFVVGLILINHVAQSVPISLISEYLGLILKASDQ